MNKGFAPILIILGVFVVALIACGAYLFGKSSAKLPTSPSPVVVSPTPQSTTDETANWKTYINNQLGYSLKYPANLFYKDLGAGNSSLNNIVFASKPLDAATLGDLSNHNKDYGSYFMVSVAGEPNKEKQLQLIIQNREEIQIGGLVGIKLNKNIVFVTRNSRTYIFDNSIYGKSIDSIIFDQILSTFKFLDQKNCDICPQFMPPAPDFCKNGIVVPGIKDACGCQGPPTCQL